MSRISVLSHPAAGHIHPTLPVVAELVRRGERVVYWATEPFRERVERTGATYRSYGDQALFEAGLGEGGILGGMAALIQTTESILPQVLAELDEEGTELLLADSHAVWANLARQVLDLPAVTLCAMFAVHEDVIRPGDLLRALYGPTPPEVVVAGLAGLTRYFEVARRLGERYGVRCPGLIDYLGNPQELNVVFTSRYFQLGGERFDRSYKFVGPSIARRQDSDFPFEELGDRPLVLISMGTMYNADPDFYHHCFDAFAGGPFQVVLAIGQRLDPKSLRTPPPEVMVRDYVPQLELLERAAVFITHGGMNSVNEGLLHGVPLVVLPQQADHHAVAGRVAELGAGVVLDRSAVSPASLRELVSQVLDDSRFRRRAEEVGRSLREAGGYERAAIEILDYKRRRGLE